MSIVLSRLRPKNMHGLVKAPETGPVAWRTDDGPRTRHREREREAENSDMEMKAWTNLGSDQMNPAGFDCFSFGPSGHSRRHIRRFSLGGLE